MKVTETTDFEILEKLAHDAGEDTTSAKATKKAVKAWIATENKKIIGGAALFKWGSGFVLDYVFGRLNVSDKLISTIFEYLKEEHIHEIYFIPPHEVYQHYLDKFGFKIIDLKDSPKEYYDYMMSFCSKCLKYKKTCEPVYMKLIIK